MVIKISLPPPKIDKQKREQQIKKILSDDFEKKEGYLSKVLVFCFMNQPLAITEIKNFLQNYYKIEIDRNIVSRNIDRLYHLNLIERITPGEILAINEGDTDIILRKIENKHRNFLNKLSKQFRKQYNNVNYVWVSNEGKNYLEWACKLNDFNFEK